MSPDFPPIFPVIPLYKRGKSNGKKWRDSAAVYEISVDSHGHFLYLIEKV
jgi:hypothetical protein